MMHLNCILLWINYVSLRQPVGLEINKFWAMTFHIWKFMACLILAFIFLRNKH
jgi:hypothetical protein